MASSDIEVTGIASLQKDLRGIADKMTKKDLAKFLRKGAIIIQKEEQAQAPVRTGIMRKAIRVRIGRGRADDPRATVSVYFANIYKSPRTGNMGKPYYALFVHNGTAERRHKKTKRPTGMVTSNPFVWRAFEAKVDAAAQKILETISKSVENE